MGTVGLADELATSSDVDGAYSLADVPDDVVSVRLRGSLDGTHLTTLNPLVELAAGSVVLDVRVIATADAARQYTSVGETADADASIILADLVDSAGDPGTGDVDNALLVSVENDGHARAVFLNVPPGAMTLAAFIEGEPVSRSFPVVAEGAVLEELRAPPR